MNILVTGANGQLGTELRNLSVGSAHNFVFTDVTQVPGAPTFNLDITNPDAVRLVVDSERIDVIVNCAAYTAVDKAEEDFRTADELNHLAPGYLAAAAAGAGATLIHVSTDYVFPGTACTPIPESAPTGPQSVYGSTKLAGERAVADSGCNYIIFRTAWLYSPYGNNFVKTMLRLTSERESVKVVYDQVGSPTCAEDLAALIMHVLDRGLLDRKGIYHFTDEGAVSWFDFARHICEYAGHKCRVEPCLSAEFPSKVKRPSYSVLDKSLVRKTFGWEVPYWTDSLKKCIEKTGK